MITLTYEFKLQPTKQQAEEIQHILDVCRSVWNYALRERKDWSTSRKSQSTLAQFVVNTSWRQMPLILILQLSAKR